MPRPTDRRIDKLIQLLVTNATVVVPGPKIASEIGVTRSTVWKWIEELRSLGVEIKGHPSSGYQLQKLPDVLVPSVVRRELGDAEIGRKVIHYFRIGSTNDVALALAAADKGRSAHGTVVVAEEQTALKSGLMNATFSACNFVFNPLIGGMADRFHSYQQVIVMVGLAPVIGMACWLLLSHRHARGSWSAETADALQGGENNAVS